MKEKHFTVGDAKIGDYIEVNGVNYQIVERVGTMISVKKQGDRGLTSLSAITPCRVIDNSNSGFYA